MEKYGSEYRNIILSRRSFSYPYIFVTEGISKEDILAYIGIRIYMGIHKCPNFETYWYSDALSHNRVNKIMNMQYFFFLANGLRFPEKEEKEDKEKGKEKKNEKEESEEKELDNLTISSDRDDNTNFRIDPRHKIPHYS